MTERLSDVQARIGTVEQLSMVVSAMRGIAAARSREAHAHLDGISAYAGMIGTAIGHALSVTPPETAAPTTGAHAVIALCAEQGFAGAFSSHVLDSVQRLPGPATLMLVGDRGLTAARERGLEVAWSAPMVAHPAEVAALANRIADALYDRLDAGQVTRVTLVHAIPGAPDIVVTPLVPFDLDRFAVPPAAMAPLLTLPPRVLLAKLVEEYVFAMLCEAVMLSFSAENEARMRAMIAAKTNVATTLDGLVARSRQLRQEEITNEIIELAGGGGLTV
jgi:F-type H+-transporting ATPase subunit gamma